MCQVNGRGRFSTSHSSETTQSIFTKLEIYNYLPDTTRKQNFRGYVDVGALGKWPVSRVKVSVLIRRSGQDSAFWGLE